jgi:alkylation response protein AidB-like acyl-CoA dehydrogenase
MVKARDGMAGRGDCPGAPDGTTSTSMPASRLDDYLARVHEIGPIVRSSVERSDRESQLPPEVIEAFHAAGLFRMLLPAAMRGGDLTIPEAFRVFEEVARLDGSAGWNLSICAGGPIFGHFLAREAFEHIFSAPRAVSAGSLNPLGTQAVRDGGGWRFSGRASYVSGSAHASWLMTAGIAIEDGAPRMRGDIPAMRAALFPIENARILQTWEMAGMRGTGSNDCVFENVLVPDGFTFDWPDPRSAWREGPFGAIPLPVQLGGAFSAVALGVARHAIDELIEIAVSKMPAGTRASLRDRPLAQLQLGQAEGLLQAGRAYLQRCAEDVWRRGAEGRPFDVQARAAARLGAVTAAKLAAQAVDLVHDAAGMNAMQTSGSIQRCWRDVHTITQHVIQSTGRYEVIGRILFGLPPGSPII